MVNIPTRNQNILDLILTTSIDYLQDILVEEALSDQNQITFNINCSPYQYCIYQYCSFKNTDWSKFIDLLLHILWNNSSANNNIDESWSAWKDFLFVDLDDCVPRVTAKKKLDTPWITKELINLCRKKKTAFRKARITQKIHNWNYYRKLNSMVKSRCNTAR